VSFEDIRCANLQGDLVKRENELKEVQDGLKEVQYKVCLVVTCVCFIVEPRVWSGSYIWKRTAL